MRWIGQFTAKIINYTTPSGLENREYGRGDLLRWPRDTLCPQELALTSMTSSGRSRTKAMEFLSPPPQCVKVFNSYFVESCDYFS
jgi:hypothetical protein